MSIEIVDEIGLWIVGLIFLCYMMGVFDRED